MKKIEIGYSIVLFICLFFSIVEHDINICLKIIILVILLGFPIVIYILNVINKTVVDSELDITLKALINELPQKEFKAILYEIIKTYDHTLSGLLKTWDRISEYAEDNFSKEN